MKTSAIFVLVSFAAGILATPATDAAAARSYPFPQLIEGRAAQKACYHESDCSWFYAAKCEDYCRQFGQDVGVDRMEKCSFLNDKRCCCTA
ncbi:hypothetical protein QBC46DRAFT_378056 [Diplogelasinospora grovesii]|uniref:Uncharacterized protein n=1 Tax=Diplogelasinospora grovesii TaxID=303347 RepID=A0AAN6NGI5_9PEZI|nr:hypothetical protein QBC46DRAFT_378056 [Diplogelasinospora grovesii]